ncbi:hypothetical protein FJY90_03855 [Candidatus Gottesmanbacteria bacterium]|nr:hypothetical protein [Candidatus Gottesmanbacteria bacterium]
MEHAKHSNTIEHKEDKSISAESGVIPIQISNYTKALTKSWHLGIPKPSLSPNRISTSQTGSFLAFLYEKMRNAVEFREEHLIRRAAIERIIKRRVLLNESGRNIAELLIKELLWARYYENNTIGEEKIHHLQSVIDKYFFLRNEIASGRSIKEQERIGSFIFEVLSCEIEEILSPSPRREAFINFVYQLLRTRVAPFNGDLLERDIQVYIAVEKAFAHSDPALIRYDLLKLMLPEITQVSWKSADKVLPRFYDVFCDIEKNLGHPLSEKIRIFIKKQIPPFLILQDIFKQNPHTIETIVSDENQLKHKVDQACRKRYEETKDRLRRTGIRSFIYIVLTKVVFAFLLEIPYDLYVAKTILYLPIIINVLFPPVLMSIIILTVTVPGDENTRRIYNLIKGILADDPASPEVVQSAATIGKPPKTRSLVFSAMFSGFYLLTYLITFGLIVYILSLLKFNLVSQGVFIFFVTLVTFFAFRVIDITQQYLVVSKEGPVTTLMDFFFLPIMRVGQWLSGEVLTKFNFFIFIFDFIVEMPLKAVIEVIDEWVHFVRLKKEEII